jgi:hypothetical protein
MDYRFIDCYRGDNYKRFLVCPEKPLLGSIFGYFFRRVSTYGWIGQDTEGEMSKINTEDGYAISTMGNNGDNKVSITISKNMISQGMVLLDANQLARLIRDLRQAYLSLAELEG